MNSVGDYYDIKSTMDSLNIHYRLIKLASHVTECSKLITVTYSPGQVRTQSVRPSNAMVNQCL